MNRRHVRPPPPPAAPAALPADVRLMNTAAASILAVMLLGGAAAAVAAAWRAPWLPIRQIELEGELSRHSLAAIRAHAAPLVAGHFLSLDLQQSREVFEQLPWVRHAVVRRVWPDTLRVTLEEHRAVAQWQGLDAAADEGRTAVAERLVNSFGEVFVAGDAGEVRELLDDESVPLEAVAGAPVQADAAAGEAGAARELPLAALPRLAGPEGSAPQMLGLLRQLQAALVPLERRVTRLALSQRGLWRAELDNGTQLVLGRGSEAELLARTERFVRTYPDVSTRWPQALAYADLRLPDGYALRLRGVSAPAEAAAAPGARPGIDRTRN